MFREMRRFKQALSKEECQDVLNAQPRGVLAVYGENGYPYAVPMDFLYLDGALYFHSAKQGHKIDAISREDRVSFCVMDQGFRWGDDWALNIRSVIVFGRIHPVEDADRALEVARCFGQKYYPDAESVEREIEKAFSQVRMLELTIDHMTGKLVNES